MLKKQAGFRTKLNIWIGYDVICLSVGLVLYFLLLIRSSFILKDLIANQFNSEIDHEIEHYKHKQEKSRKSNSIITL